jgi:hypothetical protein
MALRNPIYLDLEQLIAQAEYHDVAVPRAEEIVETSRSQRRAGAKLGLSGAGVDAGGEREVETQSTFRLEPQQRSTVSKVIDRLHREQVISTASSLTDSAIQKDDLVELDGILRMTPTTLAGKLFYLMKKAIASSDIASIDDLSIDDPEVEDVIRTVYLENELLPIPILMQAVDTGMEVRVYVNINPSHFTTADVADWRPSAWATATSRPSPSVQQAVTLPSTTCMPRASSPRRRAGGTSSAPSVRSTTSSVYWSMRCASSTDSGPTARTATRVPPTSHPAQ